MPGTRVGGLDRLRGAALVAMLIHHLSDWFGDSARDVLPGWPGFAITDIAAPAFTIALGASVPLLVESRRRRGVGDASVALTALRRYGLLIPLGVALRWAVGFDLGRLGVLETLGVCALAVAALAPTVRPSVRFVTASAVLAIAPIVERSAGGRDDWFSTHMLTGTFPLVAYLGFALAGAALVPVMQRPDHRRIVAACAVPASMAVLIMLIAGNPPDRYPGDASFLVPGLAGALLLYLVVTSPRLPLAVASAVERAGAHTLGVFVGHYAVYALLDQTGTMHSLAAGPAVASALLTTAVAVAVAPLVPTLPWSPRTGWSTPKSPPPENPCEKGSDTEPDPQRFSGGDRHISV